MKQRIFKKHYNKLLLINYILFFFIISILINIKKNYADITKHNIHAPIQIYSDYQNINMLTNTLIITGNVFVRQELTHIYANKIIIIDLDKKNSRKIIHAYGNPVIFYQTKKNHNPILATSLHISYKLPEKIIVLKGNAYLKKENNTIQSHCITYMIKNKYIKTCNDENYQSKTMLNLNIQ